MENKTKTRTIDTLIQYCWTQTLILLMYLLYHYDSADKLVQWSIDRLELIFAF